MKYSSLIYPLTTAQATVTEPQKWLGATRRSVEHAEGKRPNEED